MQLLIDEHLTPRICEWCLERRNPPLHAVHVTHRHLGATDDHVIFQYAWEHDLVVVTTNARDFLPLLNVELHPGLIVIREGGLLRDEHTPACSSAAPRRTQPRCSAVRQLRSRRDRRTHAPG